MERLLQAQAARSYGQLDCGQVQSWGHVSRSSHTAFVAEHCVPLRYTFTPRWSLQKAWHSSQEMPFTSAGQG